MTRKTMADHVDEGMCEELTALLNEVQATRLLLKGYFSGKGVPTKVAAMRIKITAMTVHAEWDTDEALPKKDS